MIIALFVLIFSEKQLSRYSVRKLSRAIARNPPNESPRFPCLPLSRPFMHHAGWGTLPCLALPCLALPCLAFRCRAGGGSLFRTMCVLQVKLRERRDKLLPLLEQRKHSVRPPYVGLRFEDDLYARCCARNHASWDIKRRVLYVA